MLGYNMYAYCGNNPVIYMDPNGDRIVGVGVQGELSVGDVSVGFEVVIYFDPEVCKDSDYKIVVYTYSGYELSTDQLNSIYAMIDAAAVAACIEESYDTFGGNDFQSYMDTSLLGQALRSVLIKGGSATAAFFAIDGDASFDDPSDYSGKFESVSFSGTVNGKTCGLFLATADGCRSYGVKAGLSLPASRNLTLGPIAWGMSYSTTYYSDPYVLYEG